MQTKYFDATIYAKQQPLPLVGDEHYPDGGVGITFKPTPILSFTELDSIITHLSELRDSMKR